METTTITRLLLLSICVSIFLTQSLSALTIGITPLENQRLTKQNDWFGFYVSERIRANLAGQKKVQLLSRDALFYWSRNGKPPVPKAKILITGEFQLVFNQAFISLQIRTEGNNKLGREEINVPLDQFEAKLDDLIQNILLEQDDLFTPSKINFPMLAKPLHKKVIEIFSNSYLASNDPQTLLKLLPEVQKAKDVKLSEIFTQAMLVASSDLKGNNNKYFQKLEAFVQKSLRADPKNGRLLALLAEIFASSGSYPSWIEETAFKGIKANPQDELAWLMLAFGKGLQTGGAREALLKVDKLNPYIWPEEGDKYFFRKGEMGKKIKAAYLDLNKVKNPKVKLE
ncbi:MAG: hypothetical protein QNL04_14730 [SAR324 cluster bacterium]|nr:hypothetical protein [SAR324 cluster bacterium]